MTDEEMTCTIYEHHKFSEEGGGWLESSKWHFSFEKPCLIRPRLGRYKVTSAELLELLQNHEKKRAIDLWKNTPKNLVELYGDGSISSTELGWIVEHISEQVDESTKALEEAKEAQEFTECVDEMLEHLKDYDLTQLRNWRQKND